MATQFANGKIVTDGLVLALNAADRNSYPGSGTTWFDTSGNNNHATLNNGTAFNSGFGGYMQMDGTDDFISIPDNAGLRFTTGFTQMILVRFNNIVTSYYRTLFGKPNYIQYGLIVEWYGSNPILADFLVGGNRNALGLTYPGSNWVLVAQSYNAAGGSNNQISYLRGGSTATLYATRTGNVDTSTDPVYIGQAGLQADVGFALLYNRGLTVAEMDQNYNVIKSRFNLK